MEHELLEHGKKLIEQMAKEYRDGDEDSPNQYDLMDGLNNYDALAVIWAAGAVSTAFEAAADEIAACITEW